MQGPAETAKEAAVDPKEIHNRIDMAKNAIWGSDGPDTETARELVSKIPGSEETVKHLDAINQTLTVNPNVYFDNDKLALDHFSKLEHSMDRLAETNGIPAVDSSEGPLSFLSHARQNVEGWHPGTSGDVDIRPAYRNFLNDVETLAASQGRHPDELMRDYLNSTEGYHSGPVGELLRKHDPAGHAGSPLTDALFEDTENYGQFGSPEE